MTNYRGLLELIFLIFLTGCAGSGGLSHEDIPAQNWNERELILSVEESLSELGYDVGEIDGLVDDQTNSAVRKYKLDMGLGVNDQIDARLESHLNKSLWSNRSERTRKTQEDYIKYLDDEMTRCTNLLKHKNLESKQILTINAPDEQAALVIYRYDLGVDDYPMTEIIINDNSVAKLNFDEYTVFYMKPGDYSIKEINRKFLSSSNSTSTTISVNANENYYLNLVTNTHSSFDSAKDFSTMVAGIFISFSGWSYSEHSALIPEEKRLAECKLKQLNYVQNIWK